MSTLRIKAGNHYHQMPPITGWPWIGKQSMEREVVFDPSCQYDSADYNSQDVNKLFGLSFGFRGVHWDSARFGWRWSKSDQCIELLAYAYVAGKKNWDAQLRYPVVAQVKLGQKVLCRIEYNAGAFYFRCQNTANGIHGEVVVSSVIDLPAFGLTHSLYFGGELPCPHDMTVQINRL